MPMQPLPRLTLAAALAAFTLSPLAVPAAAQGYFVPGQAKPAAPARGAARKPVPRAPTPTPAPVPPDAQDAGPAPPDTAEAPPPLQPQLPPPPELPTLPKGAAPPAAVIGVMGVPDVMRASSAAQAIEKTIGQRREALNLDAQKEQAAWREMQQALQADRAKLSPDQVRARERALQERITNAQRQFRDRGRIIQEAAQYALAQIERTLIAVIRQVADSRGMNLVLHRAQVALNVNEFDITDQVTTQLNKIIPTVVIPPDGVEPPTVAPVNSAVLPPPPSASPSSPPPSATPPGSPSASSSAPAK